MKRVLGTAMAASLALASSPTAAQEKDPRIAELEREKAYYEAKGAADKARADAITNRIAPLTALAGDGKTTLGTGAGTQEAWFLTREAVEAAALSIKGRLPETGTIVVLAGDEALNLSAANIMKNEIDSLAATFALAFNAAGNGLPKPCQEARADASPAFAALGAVGSLLATSTEVQGLDIDVKDRFLATAIVNKLPSRALVPSSLLVPDFGTTTPTVLANKLSKLNDQHARASNLRICIGDNAKYALLAKLLEAAIGRYDTFAQRIATPGEKGTTPLTDALIAEAIVSKSPTVLRVWVDKAGGTLLNRKNILTAFGAPAVGITGGLVASFLATDPKTGDVISSGTLACTTDLRSLRRAHRLYPSQPLSNATCSISGA